MVAALFPETCRRCRRRGTALCSGCLGPWGACPPPGGLAAFGVAACYEGWVRSVVLEAKYRGRYRVLDAFVPRLVALVQAFGSCDVVTAPPAAPEHTSARGFDPGGYLARRVARYAGLPYAELLGRVGRAQTGASRRERLVGPVLEARGSVAGRVLVVDDVVTTGSTVRHAARVLRDAGANRIFGVAAACVSTVFENEADG